MNNAPPRRMWQRAMTAARQRLGIRLGFVQEAYLRDTFEPAVFDGEPYVASPPLEPGSGRTYVETLAVAALLVTTPTAPCNVVCLCPSGQMARMWLTSVTTWLDAFATIPEFAWTLVQRNVREFFLTLRQTSTGLHVTVRAMVPQPGALRGLGESIRLLITDHCAIDTDTLPLLASSTSAIVTLAQGVTLGGAHDSIIPVN
jgi:hypothetical protein